jgi:hypothetical protein
MRSTNEEIHEFRRCFTGFQQYAFSDTNTQYPEYNP